MYSQQTAVEVEPEDQARFVAAEKRLWKRLILAGGIAIIFLVVAFL
jgi:hypothetical protein